MQKNYSIRKTNERVTHSSDEIRFDSTKLGWKKKTEFADFKWRSSTFRLSLRKMNFFPTWPRVFKVLNLCLSKKNRHNYIHVKSASWAPPKKILRKVLKKNLSSLKKKKKNMTYFLNIVSFWDENPNLNSVSWKYPFFFWTSLNERVRQYTPQLSECFSIG